MNKCLGCECSSKTTFLVSVNCLQCFVDSLAFGALTRFGSSQPANFVFGPKAATGPSRYSHWSLVFSPSPLSCRLGLVLATVFDYQLYGLSSTFGSLWPRYCNYREIHSVMKAS